MLQVAGLCRRWKPMLCFGSWQGLVALSVTMISAVFHTSSMAVTQESKLLRHVVEFQFKDSSSKDDIQKVVDGFRSLPSKISAVADFEYGVDNSPEGLANGFTHCFLLTFKSEADRDIYLKHPAHTEFVDVLKPHLEKAQVLDYWAEK